MPKYPIRFYHNPPFPPPPAGPDETVLKTKDVQAIALDILMQFDRFCREHSLRYYLCGGTLLGAVRHQGFIPWDDDVDVFMSRPEYDRLLETMKKASLPDHLQFACPENGLFTRPFARIYDLRTEVQRKYWTAASGGHVWIDILPVDGLPDDDKKIRRIYRTRDTLDKLNAVTMWRIGTAERDKYALARWIRLPIGRLVGTRRWCAAIDRLGRSHPFEECGEVGCVTIGRYGPGEAMPRDGFEKSACVTFAGHEFQTMSCYREYLSGIYGDYMTLPPEKDRKTHLNYTTMRTEDYLALVKQHPEIERDR